MCHTVVLLLVLVVQAFTAVQSKSSAYDLVYYYWNRGINYDYSYDPFWEGTLYTNLSTKCTGCLCIQTIGIVLQCSGKVGLVDQVFDTITAASLTRSVKSLTITRARKFKTWGPGTFDSLSDLTSIIIYNTGLMQFPEVSQTNNSKLTSMILRRNSIKFFSHNATKIEWPKSLKTLSLENNIIDYIPEGFFSGSSLEYVRLSYNNIVGFPVEPFRDVTSLLYLGLNDNLLTGISPEHMKYLKRNQDFKHLDIGNNKINDISPGTLAMLRKLLIFEGYGNQLTECRSGVFHNIPRILHIDLNINKIKILGSDSFTDLPNLLTLRLMSQQDPMTNIYYDAFRNINGTLTYLFLSENALPSFPHPVLSEQVYPALRQVHIDINKIRNVTEYGTDGFSPRLQTIYMTKLQQFSVWIKTPNIRFLDISRNNIPEILSSEFCPLTSLATLLLATNKLSDEKVPDDAFDCVPSLVKISLSYNLFKYVPNSVRSANLTNLEELHLEGNKITFIEAGTFLQTSSLYHIDMSKNYILVVEDASFPPLTSYIDLDYNEFRFTHENPFTNLSHLSELHLAHNKISYIPETAFHGCMDLTTLNLDYNNIGWLTKIMFKDNPLTSYFMASYNDIAYIEDGTFAHVTDISDLHLDHNKLTKLPKGGSFSRMTVNDFRLNSNRLTEIHSETFEDLIVTDSIDLRNSEISTIESGAFKDVSVSTGIYLEHNPLRAIHTEAFIGVSCQFLFLQDMEVTHIPSSAFKSVTAKDISLYNNNISYIEDGAFNDVNITNDLKLYSNRMNAFNGGIFNSSVIGGKLDLSNNTLSTLENGSYPGLTEVREVDMSNNNLTTYPSEFLSGKGIEYVDISNNEISVLSLVAFLDQSSLEYLDLSQNKIIRINKGTLDPLVSLKTLDLSHNRINYIEPGTFLRLSELRTLNLSENQLFFFPTLPAMPALSSLDLSGNDIKTFGLYAFDQLNNKTVFEDLVLTGNNNISCDCYTRETLENVEYAIIGGNCGSPVAVHGSQLSYNLKRSPKYFQKMSRDDFLCSPVDVKANSLTATDITVTWKKPESPVLPAINVTDNETRAWSYRVECENRETGITHSVLVTSTTYTFTSAQGITNNTEYICAVSLVTVSNKTSGVSEPSVVRTQIFTVDTSFNYSGPNIGDYTVPVKYYDFSITHADFGSEDTTFISKPTYVPSPYGSWLMKPGSSTPTMDTFSTWFVYKSGINQEFTSNLTLSLISTVPITHRFAAIYFYPIDDMGYGNQEEDCFNNEHNMGFTSAIRTGIVYQGSESIAVGGGDDVWVNVNGVLILEIETRNYGVQIPCKYFDFSAASATGGTTIIPRSGFVINSQCVTIANVTAEAVHLDLEIGARYHFTIFHAERLSCVSSLFIETKNFRFILSADEEPPQDYAQSKAEDLHTDSIVQDIMLADIFSSGPYEVTIMSGNEARHFTMVEDTIANRNKYVARPPVTYNYTTVNGVSFVECSSPSTITPEGNNSDIEQFTITTAYALLTLDLSLDYEVKTLYTVVMKVNDTGRTPQTTGTITTKIKVTDVNDNCPELTQTSYNIAPIPTLQSSALAQLNASDIDTGDNSDLAFSLSIVTEDPPVIGISPSNLKAMNATLRLTVVVTDNGNPLRGAQAAVEMTIDNSCLFDVVYGRTQYLVKVDNTSGEVFFRLPKYYHEYHAFLNTSGLIESYIGVMSGQTNLNLSACLDDLGLESGLIIDNQISASSTNCYSRPHKVRLNTKPTTATYGSLTGGWLANIDDTNQWLQISFNEKTRVNKIQIQGQEEADNWVTTFTLTYSSDGAAWHTFVNDTGLSIFGGAIDRSTAVEITLNPSIITVHMRMNPQTWNNHIAMRLEIIGCTQRKYDYHRTTCLGCLTTSYCVGDGTMLPCGRCDPPQSGSTCGRSPIEHSFGMATECSPCLEGWRCSNGYAEKCPRYHYIVCNATYCPSSCTQCESGYACKDGRRHQCGIGTYSDGYTEHCKLCADGMYQDQVAQSSCKNCPPGYYSNRMKDRCNPCSSRTYSDHKGSGCKSCGPECLCIGSKGNLCYSENLCYNREVSGVFSYGCHPCPEGFTGNGVSCADINECTDHNPCWNQSCVNTSPGYQCKACPLGYKGTYEDALTWTIYRRVFEEKNRERAALDYQTCNDVNECDVNYGGCDPNSYCHNTVGSHYCGTCKKGYLTSPTGTCILADFCLSGDYMCDSNAECVYTGPGEYKCVCKTGWSGDGKMCGTDFDMDGKPDKSLGCTAPTCFKDNCVLVPNSGQEDADGDSSGDACDNDADNDSRYGREDNCPTVANNDQADGDSDGVGDVCDNCVSNSNSDQADLDKDGVGDVCDTDKDADGVRNALDKCPLVADAVQIDGDGDGVGDSCDNCPSTSNSAQTDSDGDGIGDSCSTQDKDGDGLEASVDNCDELANGEQQNIDSDGLGDYCDTDIDGDGTLNVDDNCVYVSNPSQTDVNGNHRGDSCESNEDKDGIIDKEDNCPRNKNINDTSLSNFITLDFNPALKSESDASWLVQDSGRDVRQTANTLKPVALIGNQYFDHVKFMGTTYTDTVDDCYGYIGFIFGYRGSRKYYLVSWRHIHLNMDDRGGTKGVQLWLINSASTSRGNAYADALYHSYDTTGISKLLWQDSRLIGWECAKPYRWTIEHSPSVGLIRVLIEERETTIADSGYVYDVTIPGGRLGVFSFNQTGSVWSHLQYECSYRLNNALWLNDSTYGVVGNVSSLRIEKSFTIEVWVYLASGHPSTKLPIVCTNSSELCLYVEGGVFKTQIRSHVINGTSAITTNAWTHITTRYNAQRGTLTMFMTGGIGGMSKEAEMTDIEEVKWNGELVLYLGRDHSDFFIGKLDELRIYNIQIPDDELTSYWQRVGMNRDYKKNTLRAHYTMDNTTDTSVLMDQSMNQMDIILYGSPMFVESTVDYYRYLHTYG